MDTHQIRCELGSTIPHAEINEILGVKHGPYTLAACGADTPKRGSNNSISLEWRPEIVCTHAFDNATLSAEKRRK